jgi:hypothetical protein
VGRAFDFDQARDFALPLSSQPTIRRGDGHTLLVGKLSDALAAALKQGNQLLDLFGRAPNVGNTWNFVIHAPIVPATPPLR